MDRTHIKKRVETITTSLAKIFRKTPDITTNEKQQKETITASIIGIIFSERKDGNPNAVIDKNGNTILTSAATEGYTALVMQLLWIPTLNPNIRNNAGKNALIIAANNGHSNMIKHLLDHADIDIHIRDNNGYIALTYAVSGGHINVTKRLLKEYESRNQDSKLCEHMLLIYAATRSNAIYPFTQPMTKAPYIPESILSDIMNRDITESLIEDSETSDSVAAAKIILQRKPLRSTVPDDQATDKSPKLYSNRSEEHMSPNPTSTLDSDIIDLLLNNSFIADSINFQDAYGNTALIHAVANNNSKAAKQFLAREEIHVNIQNSDGLTALIYAAANGNEEIVQELLKAAAIDVNIKSNPDYISLITTTSNVIKSPQNTKDKEFIAGLTETSKASDYENKLGNTALIFAAANGHNKAASLLLKKSDIDTSIHGILGKTALIYAAVNGHAKIVKKIIKKSKKSLNLKDLYGRSALSCAIIYDHHDIASLLINTHKIDLNAVDNDNKTPLLHALYNKRTAIVRQLLKIPTTDIHIKDNNGNKAFYLFEFNSIEDAEILAFFLQHGAQINNKIPTHIITQAIIILAKMNDQATIQNISKLGYSLDLALISAAKTHHYAAKVILSQDPRTGIRALMSAIESRNDLIVKNLLQLPNIDVNRVGPDGKTVLINAISKTNNSQPLTDSFIPSGMTKEAIENNLLTARGDTYLSKESLRKNTADSPVISPLTEDYLETGSAVETTCTSKEGTSTAEGSELASINSIGTSSNSNIIELLINHSVIARSINSQDQDGKTALIHAVIHNNCIATKKLLSEKAIAANTKDKYGDTALMYAAANGNHEIVIQLLEKTGIEINLQSKHNSKALINKAFNNIEVNQESAAYHKPKNEIGNTALILAAANGHEEVVTQLLEEPHIDINLKGALGRTALIHAAANGHIHIVRRLLALSKINTNSKDLLGSSALTYSSMYEHYKITSLLISTEGIDINIIDNKSYTPLMYASSSNNKVIMKQLLEKSSIDIHIKGSNGKTAFDLFSDKGINDPELLALFLQKHADIDVAIPKDVTDKTITILSMKKDVEAIRHACTFLHNTALHTNIELSENPAEKDNLFIQAAINKDVMLITNLLYAHNHDINVTDNTGKTALMHAANRKHNNIIEILIQNPDVDVHIKDQDGKTAFDLFHFISTKDSKVLELFLQKGLYNKQSLPAHIVGKAFLSLIQKDDQEAIQCITQLNYNSEQVLAYVLKKDNIIAAKIILAQDNSAANRTIMQAALNGDSLVAKNLLAIPCIDIDANAVDTHGMTALMYVAKRGHIDIARNLLTAPNIDINKVSQNRTALMYASIAGHLNMVKYLMQDSNIDINITDETGKTAPEMFKFKSTEDAEMLEFFLETKVKTSTSISNNIMTVAIYNLLIKRDNEAIIYSLRSGDFLEESLILALKVSCLYICNAILEKAPQTSEKTLIKILKTGKNSHMINILIKFMGLDINTGCLHGKTLLMHAAENNNKVTANRLIMTAPKTINAQDEHGNTPLIIAAKNGFESVISELLDYPEIEVNLKNKSDESALTLAADNGHAAAVQKLSAFSKIDINIRCKGLHKNTALIRAIIKRHRVVAKILMSNPNIDINAKCDNGKNALQLALSYKLHDIAKQLIESPKIGKITFEELGVASNRKLESLITDMITLIDSRDDINLQDENGNTILMLAAAKGDSDIVAKMLAHPGINVNATNNEKNTALIIATIAGNNPIFKALIDHPGIDINAKSNKGETALIIAASSNFTYITKALLDHPGIDINAKSNKGETALIIAASSSFTCITKALLSNRYIDVNIQDNIGKTAIMHASNYEIVKDMLKAPGINTTLKNKQGETAFYLHFNSEEIAPLILAFNIITYHSLDGYVQEYIGAKKILINALRLITNKKHCFAIRKAFKTRLTIHSEEIINIFAEEEHVGIVKILLDQKPELGPKLLAEAINENNINIAKSLLAAKVKGIDSQEFSYCKRTPLITAARDGSEEIVRYLVEAGADINIVDFFGWGHTALSSAVTNDRVKIVAFMGLYIVTKYHEKAKSMITNTIKNLGILVSNNSSYKLLISIQDMLVAGRSFKSTKTISWAQEKGHKTLALELTNLHTTVAMTKMKRNVYLKVLTIPEIDAEPEMILNHNRIQEPTIFNGFFP